MIEGARVVKELNKETGEYEDKVYVDIIRYRRITGYLTYVHQFNNAKAAELKDRVLHRLSLLFRH